MGEAGGIPTLRQPVGTWAWGTRSPLQNLKHSQDLTWWVSLPHARAGDPADLA